MIAAVILAWNNVDDTIACIDSLRASTHPVDRVLLYDNGSTDNTAAALAAHYADDPWVQFHANNDNLGFARGVNLGIREAFALQATRVLLLNNDTIVDRACLALLAAALDDNPRAAAAAPTIPYHDRPDTIWQAGGDWNRWKAGLDVPLKNRPVAERPTAPVSCTFLTGCAMLLDRSALERAGLFDERFYFYGEDAELCLRLVGAGHDLVYVPDAIVTHKIGDIARSRMSPFVLYHRGRAALLVPRIHARRCEFAYAVVVQYTIVTLFRMLQLWRGGWSTAAFRAWFEGLADGLVGSDRRRY